MFLNQSYMLPSYAKALPSYAKALPSYASIRRPTSSSCVALRRDYHQASPKAIAVTPFTFNCHVGPQGEPAQSRHQPEARLATVINQSHNTQLRGEQNTENHQKKKKKAIWEKSQAATIVQRQPPFAPSSAAQPPGRRRPWVTTTIAMPDLEAPAHSSP